MAQSPLYYGSLQWTGETATTMSQNTPTKLLGTTRGTGCSGFTLEGDNRLVFNGPVGRKFSVTISASCTKSTATSEDTFYYIYKNGKATGASVGRTISSSSDIGAFSLTALVDLKKGDYIEAWTMNTAATPGNITVKSGATLVAVVAG